MITNNLDVLLEKHNMTITELSEKISISRNSISNLINNNEYINSYKTETLNKICSFFQISINDFLVLSEETVNIFETLLLSDRSEFNLEEYSSAGTLFVKDRFNHIGQVEFDFTFNLQGNSNILIEGKRLPVGFVKFSLSNGSSYNEQGVQVDSFTEAYFNSVVRDAETIDRFISKALEISLLEIEDELNDNFTELVLLVDGRLPPDYDTKLKLTYTIDFKILKVYLTNYEEIYS